MNITVNYFAKLREERGISQEQLDVPSQSLRTLYESLKLEHSLSLSIDFLRVAVNDEFVDWDYVLSDGDDIVFIPPVSGG